MTTIKIWGARGTLATPGPDTTRYGGNTSCVEVRNGSKDSALILDAGSGIRPLGMALPKNLRRIDLLLTHLHLDHIMGLGFFAPLRNPALEVHIWGPASTTLSLEARLMRYLAPPYFPLHLKELPCQLTLHEVPCGEFSLGSTQVFADWVCHPGPTVGYRLRFPNGTVFTYIPDHEPALGHRTFPLEPEWTSGYSIAEQADLLFHDAQYIDEEYPDRVGWGHCTINQALIFADITKAKQLVTFHFDPTHSDDELDRRMKDATSRSLPVALTAGIEGSVFEL